MEINGKSKYQVREIFRKIMSKSRPSRCRCLAYAFIREVPYRVLERKTNEDKFPLNGRNSFLKRLSRNVAECICDNSFDKIGPGLAIFKDMNRQERDEYHEAVRSITESVYSWMLEKYCENSDNASEEVAA